MNRGTGISLQGCPQFHIAAADAAHPGQKTVAGHACIQTFFIYFPRDFFFFVKTGYDFPQPLKKRLPGLRGQALFTITPGLVWALHPLTSIKSHADPREQPVQESRRTVSCPPAQHDIYAYSNPLWILSPMIPP